MANITTTGTVWNLPNYAGELFTADAVNTPILSAIGGLTEGGMQTEDFEFPTDSQYNFPEATQPAITETASLTAPAPVGIVRSQNTNVTQIFHESVDISYVKMSNAGRMSGLNTAGQENNVPDEKDFQIAKALQKIARDVEYTIINGVYAKATAANVANKTRGLLALCAGAGGTNVAAGSKALTKALMQQLFKACMMRAPSSATWFCGPAARRNSSSQISIPMRRRTATSVAPTSSRSKRTSETSVLPWTVSCRRRRCSP